MLRRYWLEVRFVFVTIFCCWLLLVVSSFFRLFGHFVDYGVLSWKKTEILYRLCHRPCFSYEKLGWFCVRLVYKFLVPSFSYKLQLVPSAMSITDNLEQSSWSDRASLWQPTESIVSVKVSVLGGLLSSCQAAALSLSLLLGLLRQRTNRPASTQDEKEQRTTSCKQHIIISSWQWVQPASVTSRVIGCPVIIITSELCRY